MENEWTIYNFVSFGNGCIFQMPNVVQRHVQRDKKGPRKITWKNKNDLVTTKLYKQRARKIKRQSNDEGFKQIKFRIEQRALSSICATLCPLFLQHFSALARKNVSNENELFSISFFYLFKNCVFSLFLLIAALAFPFLRWQIDFCYAS